ncbi:MAG: hypothetical protein RIG84_10690 [Roseovarius sp.]
MPFDQQTAITHTSETAPAAAVAEPATEPRLWPVYAVLLLVVGLWAASVVTWGIPGLFIPALLAVPCMMVVLIRLAWG